MIPTVDRLCFDDVWRILHRPRGDVGPVLPVRDVRMVAGLLFERWNDHTVRSLCDDAEHPRVEVLWIRDFLGVVGSAHVLVDRDAVNSLANDYMIERRDRLDGNYGLSREGYVRVARDWFASEFTDIMAAGATYRLDEGVLSWPT